MISVKVAYVNQNFGASATGYSLFELGAGNVGYGGNYEPIQPAIAGTISSACMKLSGAIGAGQSYTATLMQNGTPSSFFVTVSYPSTVSYSGTSIAVAATDKLSWKTTTSATAVNVFLSFVFTATTSGESSITGGLISGISSTATKYYPLCGSTPYSSHTLASTQMPTAGVLSKWYMIQGGSSGGTGSYTHTLLVNGAAPTSGLSLTFSGGTLTNQDLTNSVSVNAGDYVCIQSVPTGTPTNGLTPSYGFRFVPTVSGEAVLMGRATPVSVDQRFAPLQGVNQNTSVENNVSIVMPIAVTVKKLYAGVDVAPQAAHQWLFNMRNNAATVNGTVTIAAGATTGNDPTSTDSYVAGDLITVMSTPTVGTNGFNKMIVSAVIVAAGAAPTYTAIPDLRLQFM